MDNSNKIYCVVVNIIQFYIYKIQKRLIFSFLVKHMSSKKIMLYITKKNFNQLKTEW